MENWEGTKVNKTDELELISADIYEHEVRLNDNILVEFKNNSDAILFYDALIIANKGLTPRELLKERDELLEALKESKDIIQRLSNNIVGLDKISKNRMDRSVVFSTELIKTIES